jgi:hypothetical protein
MVADAVEAGPTYDRLWSGLSGPRSIIPQTNPLGEHSMSNSQPNNWPDLLIGLYDNLTGRRAEITYEFDDMHIKIPSGTGPSAEHAEWVLHGTLKIRTRDTGTPPN